MMKYKKSIESCFDLRVGAIIKKLDLLNVRFKSTACYGHFGRLDLDLPWERADNVENLINYFGL